MGTWGTGILDDDLAIDIKAEFDEIMSVEGDVLSATEFILESFADCLEDDDERSVVILTLAYLQIQAGKLMESIAQRALEVIENSEGLERWKGAGEDVLAERKQALGELKRLILSKSTMQN